MSNLSLYRKYRPHNFENLVGQDHVKQILINALKLDQISHAYIFAGPRGTGKTSTARLLAKALNCQNLKDNYEPCGECEFCNDISSGRLIDLVEIDAASNRGIEEIRDLKEKINYSPTRSKYKIYIIDEVHMLTTFAFNALLKTLEEPPSHSFFILATTELHKIPETIISRCQNFDFKRLSNIDLQNRMRFIADNEKITISDSSLEIVSRYVDGGMRDAISILEQLSVNENINDELVLEMLGMSSLKMLNDFYDAILKQDTNKALLVVKNLYSQGADLKNFMNDFIGILRDKLIYSVENSNLRNVSILMKIIDIFNEEKLKNYPLAQLSLEIAVIKSTFKENQIEKTKTIQSSDVGVSMKIEKAEIEKKPEISKNVPDVKNSELKNIESENTNEILKNNAKLINTDFSLENMKSQWFNVLKLLNKPSFQRSVKNGEPYKIEGDTLILKFLSTFHKDKAMGMDSKSQLENILKNVTGKNIFVQGIVDEEAKAKIVLKNKENELNRSSNTLMPKKRDTNLEQALDVFGGEIV